MTKKSRKRVFVAVLALFIVVFLCCVGALIYCGVMVSYTSYTDDGTFEAVPAAYTKPAQEQGRVVALTYTTSTYYGEETWPNHHEEAGDLSRYDSLPDQTLEKTVYVYLPYGYDENASTQYDVLYHMHGTWCDGTTLIKGEGKESETKNLLDHMIQNGDIQPMIVVFPTWYNDLEEVDDNPDYLISHFGTELERDIIPAVESTFRTYAGLDESMTEEQIAQALTESREHRGVSGYSRGATLTWNLFANMTEYFKWYVPMSGDYLCEFFVATWESCVTKTDELCDILDEKGYGTEDFFIYSTVGSLDFAYRGVHQQFLAMLTRPDHFVFGPNADEGNFYLCTAPKVWHGDTKSPLYLYNALPTLFR